MTLWYFAPFWDLLALAFWVDRRVYRPLAWLLVWRHYGHDPIPSLLGIVVAVTSGGQPPEPPIYQIQLVPPEQPAGRGQIWIALGLVVFILLMLAAG